MQEVCIYLLHIVDISIMIMLVSLDEYSINTFLGKS